MNLTQMTIVSTTVCTCGSGLTTTDPEAPVSGGLDQRWMQEDTRDPASVQEHQYAWQPHPATTQAQPALTCREQADGKELVLTAISLVSTPCFVTDDCVRAELIYSTVHARHESLAGSRDTLCSTNM